jgi:crotonobetainyl-CoA:carnitine CoA-transferase CaiB-like acyl-CoA transferase
MRLVSLATVPAGAVMDTAELSADTTFQDRGIRQTMKHPTAGDYVMSGWPVRFGGETPGVAPAPLLGQHTADVLGEWLKMEKDQIDALRGASVIA